MHDFLVCCTVLCTQRFAVVRPRCANESYVSRIYFSATCNIKGKKVRHQSKTNIFARSVRVCQSPVSTCWPPWGKLQRLPWVSLTPLEINHCSCQVQNLDSHHNPPRLLCSCNTKLTLSWPQLVPSTAPSSFEWQVVPTVHHRVLHTFWERKERSVYFLNLIACFSNIHLFPQGILSIEAEMVHLLFTAQTRSAYAT